MKKLHVLSPMLYEAGAVNAVRLRVADKPDLFSMKRDGTNGSVRAENRKDFFGLLGFDEMSVARGEQVHGDNIRLVEAPGIYPETDALVTSSEKLMLAVSVADCVPILIVDKKSRTIAAVHAGWRGTVKKITSKTIEFMYSELKCAEENIFAFIGPSAGACCYEVDREVADQFTNYGVGKSSKREKFMIDLKAVNFSQLIDNDVPKANIEVSNYCTICDTNFHSYRRDGDSSGRMLAAIGIRQEEKCVE
ncbi:MAG: peptidoglycan editing factor PgeF [Candidatus Kryptoniota bacterium]